MLREIFSDASGRLSSKRIFGAVAFVFALTVTVWVILKGYDYEVLKYPYMLAGGLLGIGVVDNVVSNFVGKGNLGR